MDQCGSADYTKNTKAKLVTILSNGNYHYIIKNDIIKNSSPRSVRTSQLIYYYIYT